MSAAQISVPQVVGHKLRAVRGRKRLLSILAGTALAAALFCGLLVTAMLLDWLITPFESAPRVLMTATVLLTGVGRVDHLGSAAGGAEVSITNGGRSGRFGRSGTGGAVDHDRGSFDRPAIRRRYRGSSAMIGQVAGEAERMHELVRPQQIVNSRTARNAASGALCGAVCRCWRCSGSSIASRPRCCGNVSGRRLSRSVSRRSPHRLPAPWSRGTSRSRLTGALQGRLRDNAAIWLRDRSGRRVPARNESPAARMTQDRSCSRSTTWRPPWSTAFGRETDRPRGIGSTSPTDRG